MKKLVLVVDSDSHQDLRELLRVSSGYGRFDMPAEVKRREEVFRRIFAQIRDKSYLELEDVPCQ